MSRADVLPNGDLLPWTLPIANRMLRHLFDLGRRGLATQLKPISSTKLIKTYEVEFKRHLAMHNKRLDSAVIRNIVRHWRRKKFPICSTNAGYWFAQGTDDINKSQLYIRTKREAMDQDIDDLEESKQYLQTKLVDGTSIESLVEAAAGKESDAAVSAPPESDRRTQSRLLPNFEGMSLDEVNELLDKIERENNMQSIEDEERIAIMNDGEEQQQDA